LAKLVFGRDQERDSRSDRVIVRAIGEIAEEIGIGAVAEGIEDGPTIEILSRSTFAMTRATSSTVPPRAVAHQHSSRLRPRRRARHAISCFLRNWAS
jgi:hypothetical protein